MKYYEITFTITAPDGMLADVRDVLAAMAGEAGLETFEDTPTGMRGYVQRQLFSEEALAGAIAMLPFEGVSVSYTKREAEDCDWNAAWEQEGFEPISIAGRITIHDGRHLPHPADGEVMVEIDAKLAFGTGTHQTTRLMLEQMLTAGAGGKTVLDCGTGTGILAISALKMGASHATAYDIDEWSADNARHNAVINGVEQQLTVLLGDATVIPTLPRAGFDLVLANINRNILLADMPVMCGALAPGGTLIISGFYEEDIDLLTARAAGLGLRLSRQQTDDQWASLAFTL